MAQSELANIKEMGLNNTWPLQMETMASTMAVDTVYELKRSMKKNYVLVDGWHMVLDYQRPSSNSASRDKNVKTLTHLLMTG